MNKAEHLTYQVADALVSFDGTSLVSEQFDDIYFNPTEPVNESSYVYVDSVNFEDLTHQKHITIAELGFGAGLNFILTADRFKATEIAQELFYVGFEKFPIAHHVLREFFDSCTFDTSIADEVCNIFKRLHPGVNWFRFPEYNTTLLLVIGDARLWLPKMNFLADAWYLDGFAPSKNPELWQESLLKDVSAKSNVNCTLASFSSAGSFRRALESNGWQVHKLKGFNHKREMIRATRTGSASLPSQPPTSDIAIVGAGIAGCALAYAYSKRGFNVTLYDETGSAASEASGNPLALVMPDMSRKEDARSFLLMSGVNIARQHLDEIKVSYCSDGIVRFPTSERLEKLGRLIADEKLFPHLVHILNRAEIGDLVASTEFEFALHFSSAFSVNPKEVCNGYLNFGGIPVQKAQITKIKKEGPDWLVYKADGTSSTHQSVVLCNAYKAAELLPANLLPFRKNYGQVLKVKREKIYPTLPICFQGYLAPIDSNEYLLGATYEHDGEQKPQADVEQELLSKLSQVLAQPSLKSIDARGSFRSGTPDRLPFIGPLPSMGENLYLNCCYGSRGFSLAPLGAEYLAAMMASEPLPVDSFLAEAISPERLEARK